MDSTSNVRQVFLADPLTTEQVDVIFDWKKKAKTEIQKLGYNGTELESAHYLNPGHLRYFFSNIPTEEGGRRLTAINAQNFPIPITNSLDMTQERNLNNILRKNMFKDNPTYLPQGIYVVDYHNIKLNRAAPIERYVDSLRYITDTENCYSYNKDIQKEIKNHVQFYQPPISNRFSNCSDDELRIRVLTFIPKEEFMYISKVYVPLLDIVLVAGDIDETIVNPTSLKFRTGEYDLRIPDFNAIRFEVYDQRLSSDLPDRMYVRCGNDILPVKVNKNAIESKAMMLVYVNKTVVMTKRCTLEEMGSKFGIFRTKEEAMINGDTVKAIELEKIKHERDKLELDKCKLRLEQEKLKLENLKIEYQYELINHDRFKIMQEKMAMVRKQAHEETVLGLRKDMEVLNYTKQLTDYDLTLLKARIDNHILLNKFRLNMEELRTKANYDKTKSELGMAATAFGIANKLL